MNLFNIRYMMQYFKDYEYDSLNNLLMKYHINVLFDIC